jgi:hypothetical protein
VRGKLATLPALQVIAGASSSQYKCTTWGSARAPSRAAGGGSSRPRCQ